MIEFIKSNIFCNEYSTIITIVCIGLIIYSMYNKIKYICLEKAAELVSSIENREDLTGKEKFAVVVLWINNTLPKVFNNALVKTAIEKLVQFAYEKCNEYMKNYVKRKTGMDVQEVVKEIKSEINTNSDQS